MLKHGANINEKNVDKATPVNCAAQSENNFETVKSLFENGAKSDSKISSKKQYEYTPHQFAIEKNNNFETVRFLLEHQAKIDRQKNFNIKNSQDCILNGKF